MNVKTKADWIFSIQDQQNSGINIAQYCREHGLKASSFYNARHRYGYSQPAAVRSENKHQLPDAEKAVTSPDPKNTGLHAAAAEAASKSVADGTCTGSVHHRTAHTADNVQENHGGSFCEVRIRPDTPVSALDSPAAAQYRNDSSPADPPAGFCFFCNGIPLSVPVSIPEIALTRLIRACAAL